jgi:hypothetical protein
MQHDGIDTDDKKMMSGLTAVLWLCDDQHPGRMEECVIFVARCHRVSWHI